MKKLTSMMLAVILAVLFTACTSGISVVKTSEPPESEVPEIESEAVEEESFEVLDYVDVMKNSDDYEGKDVVVAGRIAELPSTDKRSFYFWDRLPESDFQVTLARSFSYDEQVSDYYHIGEYVLVKGRWVGGIIAGLKDAEVLATGDEAKVYVDEFTRQWYELGESYAETLPITDYMEIAENSKQFVGQRVRIAGKVQGVGTAKITNHVYFGFRDPGTNYRCISIVLRGCPASMQDMCVEDEYVIVSGVVESSAGSPTLSDCFVECVGADAEALAAQTEDTWRQNYREQREEYISSCKQYSYEELARNPNQYREERIEVSGSVVQTTRNDGEYVVLLDVGQGNLIYVAYTSRLYQDPRILEDDQITFYGECSGIKTYLTVLGSDNTVPYVIAPYSSFNTI